MILLFSCVGLILSIIFIVVIAVTGCKPTPGQSGGIAAGAILSFIIPAIFMIIMGQYGKLK